MQGPGGGDVLADVKYAIVPYTRGNGIELGRGTRKAFPHFLAVRERSDDTVPLTATALLWTKSFADLGDHIADRSLDFVFAWGDCAGVDIDRGLLKVGGYIVRAPSLAEMVVSRITETGWVDVHWADRPHEKAACVVRYGAIGDQLQAASILPELKRQGYHVTWMCEPQGELLLRHDPHVDAFMVQDKDQVPNLELPHFWDYWAGRFDRFINLCESVEGTALKMPGRRDYYFPESWRRRTCDVNYLELTAELAELPFHPEHRFYASDDEAAFVAKEIAILGKQQNPNWVIGEKWVRPFVIMWALSGSSVHKTYPHQDAVIARILTEIPNAHIITVGDDASRILEVGWEEEPRVHLRCGELCLRDTLALAKVCDMVIGPETGVLNAVAFEPNAKVVLLSHSTEKNLTRDWVNTEALHTEITPCYPCHRLHNDHRFCPEHAESGTAMCQWDLPPATVWEAVQRAYTATGTVRKILEA